MPISKTRNKDIRKKRNVLRNNVKQNQKMRVDRGYFPGSTGRIHKLLIK